MVVVVVVVVVAVVVVVLVVLHVLDFWVRPKPPCKGGVKGKVVVGRVLTQQYASERHDC